MSCAVIHNTHPLETEKVSLQNVPLPNSLRFLHIPKTAGTTFNSYLKSVNQHAQEFELLSFNDENARNFESTINFSEELLVLGHAGIHTGISIVDSLPTITFLRDPIQRVTSFCRHVNEGKTPHLKNEFPVGRLDLNKFLESGYIELSNLQTKMLCTDFDWFRPSEATEDHLIEACRCLSSGLRSFGLTEAFYDSVFFFAMDFGWPLPKYQVQNSSTSVLPLEFKPEHLEKINEINKLDRRLYQFAVERFAEKIATCDARRRQELILYRHKVNRQRQVARIQNAAVTISRRLRRFIGRRR
jgi:hypothetical protein